MINFYQKRQTNRLAFKRINKFILPQTIIYEQQNYFFILLNENVESSVC